MYALRILARWTSLALALAFFGPGRAEAAPAGPYVVIGWNDLGMHCINPRYSELAVLPPYNNLWVQVIRRGDPPQIVTTGLSIEYSIVNNTTVQGKTDFWQYVTQLFGVNLAPGIGLTGNGLSGTMQVVGDHFEATGLPVLPYDDQLNWNPYQIASVTLKDGTGVSQTIQVVIPISDEMNCAQCHAQGGSATVHLPNGGTADVDNNVLAVHDYYHGVNGVAPPLTSKNLVDSKPVLCASCHSDNALGTPGDGVSKSVSLAMHGWHNASAPDATCYSCHPGARTQCLRTSIEEMGSSGGVPSCQNGNCHGGMAGMANPNRNPWLTEPTCEQCHDSRYSTGGALYRHTKGHGGVYCSACHNSTHAWWSSTLAADNLLPIALQGSSDPIGVCATCHTAPKSGENPHQASTATSAPPAPVLTAPANGAADVGLTPALSWSASSTATAYQVYFGTASPPPLVFNGGATSYSPGTLNPNATYYWSVSASNSVGTTASSTWSFTTASWVTPPQALQFVPVVPCRVVDTRGAPGQFGGPPMTAGSARSFLVPQSPCGIPATAKAYAMNVTVVPQGPLSFLTLWPAGQDRPLVSTLNSFAGDVVANAAIVSAGAGGGVSVYVTHPTDVILDVNGYFDSASPSGHAFYTASPCRVADTRGQTGLFGGPALYGGQARNFPVPSSACEIPPMAAAYSLNVTVVPPGALGYLTLWPTGLQQPGVSTLNSWQGNVVANAALVPSGSNGSVSVYVTQPTDVVLDVNGYFAAPGSAGALSFYTLPPCRVADTRNANGPFGGPVMQAGSSRSFTMHASSCSIPPSAAAYSLNVTVVPDGPLSYLTAWPAGTAQPGVSTLNSWDAAVTANAAIVPAGPGGMIAVYVTGRTHLILDVNGYFAP